METVKAALPWIFDGIGTELISLLVGAAIGGLTGYKLGVKKSGAQKQRAKNHARQKQKLEVAGDTPADNSRTVQSVSQKQTAGDHALQEQIGSVSHGK